MARIEWVRLRLNNWVLWKLSMQGGGLGFATQSVLLTERVDSSRDIDLSSTIDNVDAEKTNSAVESLRLSHPVLYPVVQTYYVGKGLESARYTARLMGKAESTIKANLEQIDQVLRVWFDTNKSANKLQIK